MGVGPGQNLAKRQRRTQNSRPGSHQLRRQLCLILAGQRPDRVKRLHYHTVLFRFFRFSGKPLEYDSADSAEFHRSASMGKQRLGANQASSGEGGKIRSCVAPGVGRPVRAPAMIRRIVSGQKRCVD
jgi:hypothetical protein